MHSLTPHFAVAPQIEVEDIAAIAGRGVAVIVSNRPDDEEFGQPTNAELRAAAERAGLDYVEIPVTHAGFSHPQLDALAAEIGRGAPILAFCRSGTRSAYLWALCEAKRGGDPAAITAALRGAGYDPSPVAGMIAALATP